MEHLSASAGWILVQLDISVPFENTSKEFKFHQKLTKMTGTLHEDQYTFFITSRSVLLRMRNVSDKRYRENQNTFYVQYFFFFSKIVPFMRYAEK